MTWGVPLGILPGKKFNLKRIGSDSHINPPLLRRLRGRAMRLAEFCGVSYCAGPPNLRHFFEASLWRDCVRSRRRVKVRVDALPRGSGKQGGRLPSDELALWYIWPQIDASVIRRAVTFATCSRMGSTLIPTWVTSVALASLLYWMWHLVLNSFWASPRSTDILFIHIVFPC